MAKKNEIKKEETKVTVESEKEEKVEAKAKKSGGVYFAIIVVLIVIFVSIFLLKGNNKSLEDQLSDSLIKMGSEFYTEHYYTGLSKDKSTDEVSKILKNFESIGIKVDLENLGRYNEEKNAEEIKKFKNASGKKCNQTTTRAIIYPKSPYGKNDYKVEAELDCGFESKK